jgi:hypothetical protein
MLVAACVLGLAPRPASPDTLHLRGSGPVEGMFQSYKNGRFRFVTADGRDLTEMRTRVETLRIDPPAAVSVKPQGHKKRDDLKFKAYTGSAFVFDGQGGELALSAASVSFIEPGLDFSRPAIQVVSTGTSDPGAMPDVQRHVVTGVVTVIHFHMPGVLSSVRQGNYLGELARQRQGRLELVRIEVPGFESPVARRYQITSAPQFWFYDRRGRLVGKLTERFTEEDIETALRQALR